MKWLEYATAIFFAVLLASANVFASSLGDGGVSYSVNVVSSSDLEAQLNYSFVKTSETSWIVNWRWKSESARKELTDYRDKGGELPKWLQKDSADAANEAPITSFGYLIPDKSVVDETQASGSFELMLNVGEKKGGGGRGEEKDEVKVGLHSVVIQVTTSVAALTGSGGRHLILTSTSCGGVYHAFWQNATYAFYAQSFDNGATWINQTVLADDGGITSIHADSDSNGNLHAVVYVGTYLPYYFKGTKNASCGWSFTRGEYVSPACASTSSYNSPLFIDSYDDLWFSCPTQALASSNQTVVICRHTANCSVTANWNATNNSAGWDYWISSSGVVGATSFAQQDANNIFYFAHAGYSTRACHYARQNDGVWKADSLNTSDCVRNDGYPKTEYDYGSYYSYGTSAIANSSGSIFTLDSLITPSRTALAYCSSGCNDSTNNWHGLNGGAYTNLSLGVYGAGTIGLANDSPFAAFVNDTQYFGYWYGDSTYFVDSASAANLYPSVVKNYSVAPSIIGFLGVNGSLVFFNTNFTDGGGVIPTVSNITIWSPLNASYASPATVNGVFSFVSDLFLTENCSSYLNGSLVASSILANNTNRTDVLSGLSNGNYTFDVNCFNASDYGNSAVNFSVIPPTINLKVFCLDEVTGTNIACNIGASNGTNWTSIAAAYYLNTTYPLGSLTLNANKTDYYNRTSTTIFDGTSNVSTSIYLLNVSNPATIFVRFHVQTITGSPVTDATVTISKYFGGTLTQLASMPTDGFGLASFYLDSTTSYVVSVVSSTFGSQSLTVVPVQNDYYITLNGGGGGIGNYTYSFPAWCYDNVSASFIPVSRNLFLGSNYVNQTIVASDSQLAFWGWSFYVDGALVNSSNNSAGAGGVLSWLLQYNSSNATGNASMTVFWARNNVSGLCYQYTNFNVFNMSSTGTGLVQAMQDIKASTNLGSFGFQLIVLLVTAVIIAFAARYTAVGGAIVGAVVLSMFALGNWISWPVYLFLMVTGLIAAYFVFSRGY